MALFPFPPPPKNLRETARLHLLEEFNRLPCINADLASGTEATREPANTDFELLGTGAVSADITFNAAGGFDLATHGGATDSAILLPHLDTKQTRWSGITWTPGKQPHLLWEFKTDAALTNTTIWCGLKLTNTPVLITDDDQVMFRYQNGTDTTWRLITSVAGADVDMDSGVTVAVDKTYRMWITIDAGLRPTFWINGVPIFTGAALTTGALLIPYLGVLSATNATVKKVIVRQVEASIAVS
jgi:hypothetical protein